MLLLVQLVRAERHLREAGGLDFGLLLVLLSHVVELELADALFGVAGQLADFDYLHLPGEKFDLEAHFSHALQPAHQLLQDGLLHRHSLARAEV